MPDRPMGAGDVAIGVDLGGTKTLGVLAEHRGDGEARILERVLTPTAGTFGTAGPGRSDVAALVAEVVAELADLAGNTELPVGIGLAGYLRHDGTVWRAPNVAAIEGLEASALLGGWPGRPPVVINDANCVALAAHTWRRPEASDIVAVTLGTGIGGGIVTGGRLLTGASGFAGEPGHMVVQPGGLPCPCGQHGCWERYASGSVLTAAAGERFGTAEVLIENARSGDPRAVEVVVEFSGWLAVGIGNLVNLLDPEVVVIGGGVAAAFDVFAPHMLAALAGNPTLQHRLPAIEAAPFGDASGAMGAAAMAADWTCAHRAERRGK